MYFQELHYKTWAKGTIASLQAFENYIFCFACHSNLHLEAAEAFLRLFRAYAVPPAHSSIILPIMHHKKAEPRALSFRVFYCLFAFHKTSREN